MMKKSSKVKYFGIAAAALLTVAPVMAPTFMITNDEATTVQAAIGTPATITGVTTLIPTGESATPAYTFLNTSYNNGILTQITPNNPTKTEFKDGDATKLINGVLYYVATGNFTYNNSGNTVLKNGEYYIPASIALTYGYAVNQYFHGTPTSVTTDGITKADPTVVTAITDQFANGTALVTAAYTGTITIPATAGTPAVAKDTPVYKLADGTYNTAKDGTGTLVATNQVTSAVESTGPVVTDDVAEIPAIPSVKEGTVVYLQDDGTYNTAEDGTGTRVTADNVKVGEAAIPAHPKNMIGAKTAGLAVTKVAEEWFTKDGTGDKVAADNVTDISTDESTGITTGKVKNPTPRVGVSAVVTGEAGNYVAIVEDEAGNEVEVPVRDDNVEPGTPKGDDVVKADIAEVPNTPAVGKNTPVYLQDDGTYNTEADGTGTKVEASNVTPAVEAAGAYVTADVAATPGTKATTQTVQYYAVPYRGTTYFVPATGLTLSTVVATANVTGLITTNRDDVPTFNDPTTQNYTGNLIRTKGTQLLVDQVATVNGEVVAYHIVTDADTAAGTWVRASDVAFNDSVLVASATKGTVIANADNTPLYTNKATTTLSGDSLVEGQSVNFTRVVKNSVTGEIVAYGYVNTNQGDSAYNSYVYVKASDVTVDNAADLDIAKLPVGTAVYSNYKAAMVYSDAAATKDAGAELSTKVNEWSAFETSTDADGNIVAYRLGKNQWVKAADLELQQDLDGTFDVAVGTTLYATDGDKTGAIENGGAYKVFAVRYINGKQSLKLGTDNQWVIASQGDFYPA